MSLTLDGLHEKVRVLSGEHDALLQCLARKDIISQETYLAQLHRRHFEKVCGLHPHDARPTLMEDWSSSGAVGIVANFAGLPQAVMLDRASRQFRHRAVGSALQNVRDRIIVCGGSNSMTSLASVEQFDPAGGVWTEMPPMSQARSAAAAAVLSGRLYVCGGHDSGPLGELDSAERFDPLVGAWEDLPPLRRPRQGASSGTVGGVLYVLGGSLNGGDLSSMERFNEAQRCWEELPSHLLQARHSAAAATVVGHICICGGTGASQMLRSAEYFDRQALCWRGMPPMRSSRSSPMAAVVDTCLYVFGGCRGESQQPLDSLERFDHIVGVWETMSLILEGRVGGVAAAVAGRIFICGGSDGQSASNAVRSFDTNVDAFEERFPSRESHIDVDALQESRLHYEHSAPMSIVRHKAAGAVFSSASCRACDSACFLTASI